MCSTQLLNQYSIKQFIRQENIFGSVRKDVLESNKNNVH